MQAYTHARMQALDLQQNRKLKMFTSATENVDSGSGICVFVWYSTDILIT